MRYEILGPVRVVDRGRVAVVAASKLEALLTTLVMRSDEVVGADRIVRELWHQSPPRQAMAGVQNYISRLRSMLSPYAQGGDPIVTHRRGYQLRFGPADDSDLHGFVRLLNEGRSQFLDGRFGPSLSNLDRALALWRGPVLGGQRTGPIVSSVTSWLAAARVECAELAADARERLGAGDPPDSSGSPGAKGSPLTSGPLGVKGSPGVNGSPGGIRSLRASAVQGGFDDPPDDEGDRPAHDGLRALHGADPAAR